MQKDKKTAFVMPLRIVPSVLDGKDFVWVMDSPDDAGQVRRMRFRAEEAAFIVRACNNHDALVKALNQSLMALVGYLPAHRNTVTDAAIENARAALTAAGAA